MTAGGTAVVTTKKKRSSSSTALGSFLLWLFVCVPLVTGQEALNYFGPDASTYQSWYTARGTTYENTVFLPSQADTSNGIGLFWTINETDQTIQFGIAAAALGWVGFGISSTGAMFGSDIIFFVASEPDTISDLYIGSSRSPVGDAACQNWLLVPEAGVSPVTSDGMLIFEVIRPLDTQDPQDLVITDDSAATTVDTYTKLISAWGNGAVPGFHGVDRTRNLIRLFDSTEGANSALVTQSFDSLAVDPTFGTTTTDGECVTASPPQVGELPTVGDPPPPPPDVPTVGDPPPPPPDVPTVGDPIPPPDTVMTVNVDPRAYFGSDSAMYEAWYDARGSTYPNHALLTQESDSTIPGTAIFWKILEEEDSIQFGIVARATGWVAFGMTPTGGMLGADVVAYVATAPTKVTDWYIQQPHVPSLDDCSHWELVSTEGVSPVIGGGFMIFETRRPLDTMDSQDLPITDDSLAATIEEYTKVISAWGDTVAVSFHGTKRSRHLIQLFDATNVDELLTMSVPFGGDVPADFGDTPPEDVCNVEVEDPPSDIPMGANDASSAFMILSSLRMLVLVAVVGPIASFAW